MGLCQECRKKKASAPDEEIYPGIGVLTLQFDEGVHGEASAAQARLKIAHRESGIVGHRQLEHFQSVIHPGPQVLGMGRVGVGHEKHLVQADFLGRLQGSPQVGQMHRVKGAAHDGQFLRHLLRGSFPVSLMMFP